MHQTGGLGPPLSDCPELENRIDFKGYPMRDTAKRSTRRLPEAAKKGAYHVPIRKDWHIQSESRYAFVILLRNAGSCMLIFRNNIRHATRLNCFLLYN